MELCQCVICHDVEQIGLAVVDYMRESFRHFSTSTAFLLSVRRIPGVSVEINQPKTSTMDKIPIGKSDEVTCMYKVGRGFGTAVRKSGFSLVGFRLEPVRSRIMEAMKDLVSVRDDAVCIIYRIALSVLELPDDGETF